ncbi:MAG: hypothetical protein KDE26_13275, partial [Bacteroidetes bacterium]|nr:hypothetical protein [Bacteroidota bacterium]
RGDDIELLFNYFALEFGEKYNRDAIVLTPEAKPLLQQYRWPGNVRELRNLVEKLTVLVKGELVSATVLQKNLMIQESYLPSVVSLKNPYSDEPNGNTYTEDRNMMMKLIYDLGKEVADLKKMFLQLGISKMDLDNISSAPYIPSDHFDDTYETPEIIDNDQLSTSGPALLEESLSLAKKEKEMIIKALNKHSSNRKKAATELGISERTLYRKIQNYDIDL